MSSPLPLRQAVDAPRTTCPAQAPVACSLPRLRTWQDPPAKSVRDDPVHQPQTPSLTHRPRHRPPTSHLCSDTRSQRGAHALASLWGQTHARPSAQQGGGVQLAGLLACCGPPGRAPRASWLVELPHPDTHACGNTTRHDVSSKHLWIQPSLARRSSCIIALATG